MSGAKALIDEIRKQHYSNVNTPKKAEANVTEVKEKKPMEKAQPQAHRRRGRKPKHVSTNVDVEGLFKANALFTVTIVGGLALPDYPLEEGEKLAIAKLTPIKVAT